MELPDFKARKGPILMLNLLKFKDRKHYFEQYLPAFNRVITELGIEGVKVALVSKVIANVIADEDESWDEIALVEYPNATAFKIIAESEAYHTIAEPHRIAALTNLKLFMTQPSDL